MRKRITVRESEELVTIRESDRTGTYQVTWHRTDGPHEEFEVTCTEDENVEEAVANDLKKRLGP